jgi:hypothetical protein
MRVKERARMKTSKNVKKLLKRLSEVCKNPQKYAPSEA